MGCYPTFRGKMTPFTGRRGVEGDRGCYCSMETKPSFAAMTSSGPRVLVLPFILMP